MTTLLRAHKAVIAILVALGAASVGAAEPSATNQIELDNARMKYELAIGLVEGHTAAKDQTALVQLHPDGRVSVKKARQLKEPEAIQKLEELTDADLELAERVWQIDQVHAMVTLRRLVAKVERSGLADSERTVSKAYWLLSNAIYANNLSCDMAYQAMYKSIALGFVDHWPHQFAAYKGNLSALHNCVPAEKRENLMAQAQASLDKTPLRNRAKPELAAAAGMTANAEGFTRTPVNEAPAENRISKALKLVVPTAIGIILVIAAFLAAGKIMEGRSGAPASPSGSSAAPGHPEAPTRVKRQVAMSKRRVGMQRLKPWN